MLLNVSLLSALLAGCGGKPVDVSRLQANDAIFERLSANAKAFAPVAEIDHARLAHEAGEKQMPPSRVLIFNDPKVATALLQVNPLIGLDLPFRVLAYEDEIPVVAFAEAGFLRARHGIADSVALDSYTQGLQQVLAGIDPSQLRPVTDRGVTSGYGIVTLNSDFDVSTTVVNLKTAVTAESDTIWFGEVDFSKDAEALGVSLPPVKLLLFGAPAPGAKAMIDYPRLGLDAFCQKVLVMQNADNTVTIHLNDIEALARLHYGEEKLKHRMINQRIQSNLSGAITKNPD